jgi:fatty acid CoA ligase FadD36
MGSTAQVLPRRARPRPGTPGDRYLRPSNLAVVLLASLNPAAVAGGHDLGDAVRIDGATLSRSDLVGAATSVAERVGGAHRVAVLATPTVATVLAVTGCLIAGVPVVPVPADVGAAERRHILTDSGAQAWLGDLPDETEGLPHVPVRLHARSWHRYQEPPPDATALVVYTSGTTGPPKGVVISRRAIAADVDALAQAWQWTADDTLVHGLPLFHVHGLVLGLLGSLRIGNRLVHTGRPTPGAYAAAHGSLYFGVPTVWSRVVADVDAALALAPARLLVSGSAPLPVPVFDELVRLTGHAPVERYGSTESLITLSTLADGERRPGWVGQPLAGVSSRLVDDDGAAVAHDGETIGRLEIRGPMLFDGYLNRPDATAEVLDADGWYRTGDMAVVDGGGMHRIVGRESVDLIKSGGYRIGAGEIEAVLLGHAGVREAAVVGVPDDDLGQRIVAFVVGEAKPADLIEFVASQLSVHKRPREVRVVDGLPRNAMGKVLKKELVTWA